MSEATGTAGRRLLRDLPVYGEKGGVVEGGKGGVLMFVLCCEWWELRIGCGGR